MNESLSQTLAEHFRRVGNEDFLEIEIPTPKGTVDFLAEIIVEDDTLHIKDIVIYGRSKVPLKGLAKIFLTLRDELVKAAREAGFGKVRITGRRTEKSTSASPGKEIDIIVDIIRPES